MLHSPSKIPAAVRLSAAALSLGAASVLLASCGQADTAWADPDSLVFDPSDFDGSGPVTRTTSFCYTGPGQVACSAQVPSPFSLASGSTTEQFSVEGGSCHDLVVSLAEPADLEESLQIAASGETLSGTVVVDLLASAQDSSGDAGATDGGGTDGGGTDGGSTADGGGSDGGGTDGGSSDGGGTEDGGGSDDTGEAPPPCPPYSGLNSTAARTYQTTDTYESSSGISGTQTITVDTSDPAAPVLVVSSTLLDNHGDTTVTTERQHYTCDSASSTLVLSEVEGTVTRGDGKTLAITRTDTYSDGMVTMVADFGPGSGVSDSFTFEREDDGPTQTIYGSNTVTAAGSTTIDTSAGAFYTIQARVVYSAASETQDYTAYFDEDLGMVKSFYWDLVSVEE